MDDFGLEQHVPEALRPRQIERQEQAADDDQRQGDLIADAGQLAVAIVAEAFLEEAFRQTPA